MNAIIVDDETAGRKILERLLADLCPDVRVVGSVASAGDARRAIAQHRPDLVFLDVEMPGESGIDLLRSVQPAGFEVIFVTAHRDYAVDAIRLSALDYLLKPVRGEELLAAVTKAKEVLSEATAAERMQALFHNLTRNDPKLGISTRKGVTFVKIAEIVRCESESNYTRILAAPGGEYLASRTLKHFEDILAPHGFIRVHQSHLVNVRFIREYVRGEGDTLVLTDGSSVEVSRRFREQVLARLEKI